MLKQTTTVMITLFKKIFGSSDLHPQRYKSQQADNRTQLPIEKSTELCYLQWNLNDRQLKISDVALELLGLPVSISPSFADFKSICHPEDVEHVGKMIDAMLFKKHFPDFYCRVITQSHNVKHIFVTGEVKLDNDNSITSIKALLQDVTEQRLHIQKIQLQSRRLEDIAWLQSHKMRSPVATIMGLIQLFNSEDPNDPINIKILEGVKEAAGNLDAVIKEINSKTDTMKVAS